MLIKKVLLNYYLFFNSSINKKNKYFYLTLSFLKNEIFYLFKIYNKLKFGIILNKSNLHILYKFYSIHDLKNCFFILINNFLISNTINKINYLLNLSLNFKFYDIILIYLFYNKSKISVQNLNFYTNDKIVLYFIKQYFYVNFNINGVICKNNNSYRYIIKNNDFIKLLLILYNISVKLKNKNIFLIIQNYLIKNYINFYKLNINKEYLQIYLKI